MIDATWRLYGVCAHPAAHSLSPQMQNAALAAAGINGVYLAFDVPPAALGDMVRAIRALGIAGMNVSIPHKRAVGALLDGLEGDAVLSGSVNTIIQRQGRLIGYSTDGEGFIRSLREEAGYTPRGKKICLLGTGGAALALTTRLIREEAAGITLVTRGKKAAPDWPATAMGGLNPRMVTYDDLHADPGLLDGYDLLINTTPLGMHPDTQDMPPVPVSIFHPGLLVYDLIYNPRVTRLMAAAGKAGAKVLNGLGMLVYQGAASFELWTGRQAPVRAMREALEACPWNDDQG